MTQLPPPRDLPPYRRARMRADLQRAVVEPARRRRSAPLIATAGLTVGALAAVAVWLVPEQPQPVVIGQAPTSQAVTTAVSPTTTPPAVLFGLTPAEVAAIENGCGRSALGAGGAPHTPGVGDTAETVKLRNLLDDDAGRLALLHGNTVVLTCEVGGPTGGHNAGLSTFADTDGPVTIDVHALSAGERSDGKYPNTHGTDVLAGRVTDDRVARVTVTKAGTTVTATLSEGTYLARFVHEIGWKIPNEPVPTVVSAYDANGVLLDTVGE